MTGPVSVSTDCRYRFAPPDWYDPSQCNTTPLAIHIPTSMITTGTYAFIYSNYIWCSLYSTPRPICSLALSPPKQLGGSEAIYMLQWCNKVQIFHPHELQLPVLLPSWAMWLGRISMATTCRAYHQGGLTPIIHYTRLNCFIKGGEVTTPTITRNLFSPHDVMNTLITLNNELPEFPHTPAHLAYHSSPTLHNASSNSAHYYSYTLAHKTSFFPQQVQFPHKSNETANEVTIWTTCSILNKDSPDHYNLHQHTKPSHQLVQALHNALPHTHHLTPKSLGLAEPTLGLFFWVENSHHYHLAVDLEQEPCL